MDKKCVGCKYRVFAKDDVNERWGGFCSNPDAQKYGIEWSHKIHRGKYTSHDDVFMACVIVQTGAVELDMLDECPYKEIKTKKEMHK